MAWTFGDFRLDPERFQLTRCGQPLRVEPQVLSLLNHLVCNRHRMVTKDEIVAAVWHGSAVSDASISSRIRSARRAIDDDGRHQCVIQTVHGRGFRFVAEVVETIAARAGSVAHKEMTEQRAGRPSIAVLPFQTLGGTPDLAILGEAIPHEIIQALSCLRWLTVIARGSSYRFGEARADLSLDAVAGALGVRYVLSGMIEKQDHALAVVVELSDALSGEVLWADRLVAPLDAVGELRARIVAHLVSSLELHIPFREAHLAALSHPESLDAWANYHLGLRHLYRFTPADTALAKDFFERAVAADPRCARAYGGLSFTSFLSAFLRLDRDPAAAARAARRHAERGMELDPQDPFTNFNMGRSYWLTDEPEMASVWLDRATALNPNYAQGFYASAFTAMLTGDAPTTLNALDISIHLSPIDPLLYGVHGVRAQMLIQQEDYLAAAAWADRAATAPGAHYLIAMIALAANGLAGHTQKAAHWRRETMRLRPDATADGYLAAFATRDASSRKRIATELRRHGF